MKTKEGGTTSTTGADEVKAPSAPPSWASHLDQKLAPMPLLLVQAFVNTLDLGLNTDILAHAEEAWAWLADAGLLAAGLPGSGTVGADPGFGEELRLAREVRESLRALIRHNTDGRPLGSDELRPLEEVLRQAQPQLGIDADGQVRLGAASPGGKLADGLVELLLVIRDAQADGSWDRMKLCGNPDCLWAFYDRSHGRRGAWCDMAACGNRLKNRNLRARRAGKT